MDATSEKANAAFFDQGPGAAPGVDASLTGRSIWSSGISTLPSASISPQVIGHNRPSSSQQNRMMTQSASAETLFNSMPNQNDQKTGSNRSSPGMAASAVFDSSKRALTPSSNIGHSARSSVHGDIWYTPSSNVIEERTSHSPRTQPRNPLAGHQRQYG